MGKDGSLRRRFAGTLAEPFLGDELFDRVPDTVYFVKDADGRYVAVNDTLVARCRLKRKDELIGRTAREAFPPPLGDRFAEQDRSVLSGGPPIHGQLELHLYPGGREGWGLTWKTPLFEAKGEIAGLCGITRDLPAAAPPAELTALAGVLDHVQANLDGPLRLPELARRAGLSVFQLDRRVRDLFGLTAGQYVTRARIERARDRLRRTDDPIGRIALDCGYADQAAFTRQFRKSVGITPKTYREG